MTDQQRPDDLADLRARLAAQEATLGTLRGELTRLSRRRRIPRGSLPLILAALLVALVPLATLAATPFTDLTGGPHDDNIDAIFNAGITKGCDATSYCPTANVTREEMASFLARTAGLGGNPPVANAKTAQTATSAGNATTVGGRAPETLVRAAQVDKRNFGGATTTATPLATLTLVAPTAGFVQVTASVFTYGRCLSSTPCAVLTYLRDEASNGPSRMTANSHALGTYSAQSGGQSYTFPVAAGTRTFTLFGYNENAFIGDGGAVYQEVLLDAIFVPFGYNGGTTLAP